MAKDLLNELRREREDSMRSTWRFVIVVIAVTITIWIVSACIEANAYNHLTGSQVTTWDAMFVDLRVQAEPKK